MRRLRLEVIVDAQTPAGDQVRDAVASATAQAGPNVEVTTMTRQSAARAFARPDVDVYVLVSPGHRLTAGALLTIERTFDHDAGAELMFGPEVSNRPFVGWCPERLRSHDYLGGVVALRAPLAHRLIGLASRRCPYHRWDLVLRAAELVARAAISDRPLATRTGPAALLSGPEAVRRGRQVLHDHLVRSGVHALAETTSSPGVFRARRVLATAPAVSVLIPSPGSGHRSPVEHLAALAAVLGGVAGHTLGRPVEVIVVTDDDLPSAELRVLGELCEGTADLLPVCRAGSKVARHVDVAAAIAHGEVFVVVDDTTVVDGDPDWIDTLVALALDPLIAVACASAGRNLPPGASLDPPIQTETPYLATGCAALRRTVYEHLGGLPERRGSTGLQLPHGLTCVWTPFVRLRRHHAGRSILSR